jgi:hypothetical protein
VIERVDAAVLSLVRGAHQACGIRYTIGKRGRNVKFRKRNVPKFGCVYSRPFPIAPRTAYDAGQTVVHHTKSGFVAVVVVHTLLPHIVCAAVRFSLGWCCPIRLKHDRCQANQNNTSHRKQDKHLLLYNKKKSQCELLPTFQFAIFVRRVGTSTNAYDSHPITKLYLKTKFNNT